MRGQKQVKKMKRGQTIVAERECVESESERLQKQKRISRKRRRSVFLAVVVLGTLGFLAYTTGKNMVEQRRPGNSGTAEEYVIKAEIVDEDNRGQISTRTRTYIAQLEQDFKDLGYTVVQITLPTGMSRELYVDIAGREEYYKVSTDRDTAVTAEDVDRMIRYLKEHEDLHPAYVDVRVEGRAYYK